MTDRTAPLTVHRGTPDGEQWTEDYAIPYTEGMSILDALRWIREKKDSSLAVRYSCINANACKECMLRVDGKTEYACTARLAEAGAVVEPLRNKRLIRDLVTDIVPPKEQLAHVLAEAGDG